MKRSPDRASLEISGVSPELEALIKAYDLLPRANYPAFRELEDQNGGRHSPIGKSVAQTYNAYDAGMRRGSLAVFAFPARGPADFAAKILLREQARFHWTDMG